MTYQIGNQEYEGDTLVKDMQKDLQTKQTFKEFANRTQRKSKSAQEIINDLDISINKFRGNQRTSGEKND